MHRIEKERVSVMSRDSDALHIDSDRGPISRAEAPARRNVAVPALEARGGLLVRANGSARQVPHVVLRDEEHELFLERR
jgi:hypothetical protein